MAKSSGMVVCGIYEITSPSNRVYIGQSININKRWKNYKNSDCKGQPVLYKSFKKYSPKAHIFEIIEECDKSELNCRERFWQDEYEE